MELKSCNCTVPLGARKGVRILHGLHGDMRILRVLWEDLHVNMFALS